MAEEKIKKISVKEEEEYLILEEEEEQPKPHLQPQQQQKILIQKLLSNKPSIPDSKKRILVPPPPLLLKKSMRAHSDLENLLKAGQQIAKRDPGFRRLSGYFIFKNIGKEIVLSDILIKIEFIFLKKISNRGYVRPKKISIWGQPWPEDPHKF